MEAPRLSPPPCRERRWHAYILELKGRGWIEGAMQSVSVYSCGPCCIATSYDGRNIMMGGPDGAVKIGSSYLLDEFPDCCNQEEPITSVAFDPTGLFGAIACKESRKVLLISLEDYAVAKVLHRPRLYTNDLCFSPNGQYVAIASAEHEVQVAAVGDTNPTITLRQNGMGAVKSVSFDNSGNLLATISASGCLEMWRPFESTDTFLYSAKVSDNDPRETSPLLLRCCWTNSNNLVTPYFKDIRILDKDFKPKATLSGHHKDNVSQVVLGADGNLLASLSVDGVCCIWDVKTETLVTFLGDVPKGSMMTWPSGSADIVFVDRNGSLKIWKNAAKTPVSPDASAASRAEASSAMKTAAKPKTGGRSTFMDDEAEVSGSASEDERSGSEDAGEDDMKDFIDETSDSPQKKPSGPKGKRSKRRLHGNLGDSDSDDVDDDFAPEAYAPAASKQQPHVQQCNCSSDEGIHSIFGYNHKASVRGTLSGKEEYNAETDIVVEFHDKVKNRPIRFKTPHKIVRGCLGDAGVILASDRTKNDPPFLSFRGIPDQGRDSKWEMALESGSVALAVGDSWSAVAFEDRTLRIITGSGLVSALFCIPGDVVMLTARNSMLAVAYHAGEATFEGDQNIVVAVYDVFKRRQITVFPLALSVLAHLSWMAFDDNGTLFTFDSSGVFRVVSEDFGCAQVPMKLEAEDKRVWPVDIADEEIFYVQLRSDQMCPTTDTQASPYLKTSPLITVETQLTSKQSSAAFNSNEAKYIKGMALSRGVDTESDAFLKATYGPLLAMMDACIKEDRSQRVKEIAKLLKPSKMHVMAVKLANKAHRTILAEQLQEIFDQMQDVAESSDSDDDDEHRYRNSRPSARRQQHNDHEATSDHSDHEDPAPENDHDRYQEQAHVPVLQPKESIPLAAPVAADALSKKSLGVNPFKKRAIEAHAMAAKPADLMAILNGRSNPTSAAATKAAPVAKGKASKVAGKV